MENWVDVPGFEGKYTVSDEGNVKSLNYRRSGKEKLLKPGIDGKGYRFVVFCRDGVMFHSRVGRLVYSAFNGPIPPGMQVNHINEDKMDDRLCNLNLMTPKENVNWGTRTERVSKTNLNRKDLSKWVIKLSLNNEILHFYPSMMQAERDTGLNHKLISMCCTGMRKTTGGYVWKYVE